MCSVFRCTSAAQGGCVRVRGGVGGELERERIGTGEPRKRAVVANNIPESATQWLCPACLEHPRQPKSPFTLCQRCCSDWHRHEDDWRHFFRYEDFGPPSPNTDPREMGVSSSEPKPPRLPSGCNFWTMATCWARMSEADRIVEEHRTDEELRAWHNATNGEEHPPSVRNVLRAWYGIGEDIQGSPTSQFLVETPELAGKNVKIQAIHAVVGLTLVCPVRRGGESGIEFLARIARVEATARGASNQQWRAAREAAYAILNDARIAYSWAGKRVAAVNRPTETERLDRLWVQTFGPANAS